MTSLAPIEFNEKSAFIIHQDGLFGHKKRDRLTYKELNIPDKQILEATQLNYMTPLGTAKELIEERMCKKYGYLNWQFMKFAGRLPTREELKQYIWLVVEPQRSTLEEVEEWERRLNVLQEPILKEKLLYQYETII